MTLYQKRLQVIFLIALRIRIPKTTVAGEKKNLDFFRIPVQRYDIFAFILFDAFCHSHGLFKILKY